MNAEAAAPAIDSRFFITGGTMASDAASYIHRSADDELFKSLAGAEFCYVLNARQMGKSSLMVSTAGRLASEGIRTVVIDLTSIGQNVTLEQWYFGVLATICDQLGLQNGLLPYWKKHLAYSPQQRWLTTLRLYILPKVKGQLVIFIDEIDLVRSLDFRTYEFFAGIREMHNRRSTDPDARRVTFCLLGVVTPAELIEDTQTTPFNIGVRIPLSDFTPEEAQSLAQGLSDARDPVALLQRVLYWTDGHPYLTQRLCRAISEDQSIRKAADVDEACRRIFFSHEGRDRDDNLLFVRERLVSGERGILLQAYLRILRGPMKAEFLAPATLASLVLSGVVKVKDGVVRVRNRLYARAFDRNWVMDRLPTAEARRVRRAFWSGVFRTTVVLGGLSLSLGLALAWATWERNRADEETKLLSRTADHYENYTYDADISLADQMLRSESPDQSSILNLFSGYAGPSWDAHLGPNRFEWLYLYHVSHPFWTVVHKPLPASTRRMGIPYASRPAALVSNGTAVALGEGSVLAFWRTADGVRFAAHEFGEPIRSLTADPKGRTIAVAFRTTLTLWDVRAGKALFQAPLSGSDSISSGRFSRDGRYLAISGGDDKGTAGNNVDLFEVPSGKRLASTKVKGTVSAPDFDPRSERLALGYEGGVKVCDGLSRQPVWRSVDEVTGPVMALTYDFSGAHLFVGRSHGLQIFDTKDYHLVRSFDKPALAPTSLVSSSDEDRTFLLSRVGMVYRMDESTNGTFTPILAPPADGSRLSVGEGGDLILSEGPDVLLWQSSQIEPRVVRVPMTGDGPTFASFCSGGDSILFGGDSVAGTELGLLPSKAKKTTHSDVECVSESRGSTAEILREGGVKLSGSSPEKVLLQGEKLWQAVLCDRGQRLMTLSRKGSLVLWDLKSLKPIVTRPGVTYADTTRDGAKLVATALGPGDEISASQPVPAQSLIMWNQDDGWSTLKAPAVAKSPYGDVVQIRYESPAFSPDGQRIYCLRRDPEPQLMAYPGTDGRRSDFTVLPSGTDNLLLVMSKRTVAVALSNGHVVLLSQVTGRWLADLAPPSALASRICCLKMSPRGDRIAAAYDNGTLCIWSAPRQPHPVVREEPGNHLASATVSLGKESAR